MSVGVAEFKRLSVFIGTLKKEQVSSQVSPEPVSIRPFFYEILKTGEAGDSAARRDGRSGGDLRGGHVLVTVHVSARRAGVPPQILLSASLCSVAPPVSACPLRDRPHLNMPRRHLPLNGPLSSKMPDGENAEKEMFPSFKLTFSTETRSSTFTLFFFFFPHNLSS